MNFIKSEFRDSMPDNSPSWSMTAIPESGDQPTPYDSVVFRTPSSPIFTEEAIYARSDDSSPLYYFSQHANIDGKEDTLHFYLASPEAENVNNGTPRMTELYNISRSPNFPWPHGPEYIVKARHPTCLAKTSARFRRNWGMIKGVSWIVSFGYQLSKKFDVDHQVMQIRYHKGRWRYGPGRIVVAHEETSANETCLVFEGEILRSKALQDVVVCACVTRIWYEMSVDKEKPK